MSMTDDERLLTRHIKDLARRADNTGRSMFSCFLDERQLALCSAILDREGFSGYKTDGGYDGARRRVIIFPGYGESCPFTAVAYSYRQEDKPSHCDFLGTLMALDIKRETVGDILVGPSKTIVFVLNSVCPLAAGITKVGGVGVRVLFDFCEEDIPGEESVSLSGTVSSLRLDAVAAIALRLSREKTQELIRTKGITLNYLTVFDPGAAVSQGDVFSVRGYGRFKLSLAGGLSKKGRIFITVDKSV